MALGADQTNQPTTWCLLNTTISYILERTSNTICVICVVHPFGARMSVVRVLKMMGSSVATNDSFLQDKEKGEGERFAGRPVARFLRVNAITRQRGLLGFAPSPRIVPLNRRAGIHSRFSPYVNRCARIGPARSVTQFAKKSHIKRHDRARGRAVQCTRVKPAVISIFR